MKKKDIKILAIVAVVLAIALVIVYLLTSYRGPDGLTFKEARMLKKYGAAEITKEELEEAIDLDKYNETIAFYDSDPSFGDRIQHFFGGGNSTSSNKKTEPENTGSNADKKPADPGNDDSGGSSSPSGMTYEKYIAMTPERQQAYFESYSNPNDFFKWYNSAKAEYDKNKDVVDVEGGNIDIGDYMD